MRHVMGTTSADVSPHGYRPSGRTAPARHSPAKVGPVSGAVAITSNGVLDPARKLPGTFAKPGMASASGARYARTGAPNAGGG